METPVTIWDWVDEAPGDLSYHAFGALLRRLHTIADGFGSDLIPFDPIAKIERRMHRLRNGDALDRGDLEILEEALARAAAALSPPVCGERADGWGIVHGDALSGNALHTRNGPVLVDFDSIVRAPAAWDLAPTLVAVRRYGLPAQAWDALLDGYGVDRPELEGIEPMAIVKELSISVALCLSAGRSGVIDREIAHRLAGWAAWDTELRWRHPGRR